MMSRDWAAWAWKCCRQLALPRSGIVVVLLLMAAVLYLTVGGFPIYRQYEVFSINGRPLPLFLTRNGRLVAKYRPTLKVVLLPTGDAVASGWVACNPWSGRVRGLRSGLFILGPTYQTALGCAPAAMEIARDFNAALARVMRWRRDGAELVLMGSGAEIRLRPTTVAAFSQER